jgi:cystathionine beta-lyase
MQTADRFFLRYNPLILSLGLNMIYDFDQKLERRKTESEKWRCFEEDVLPMWVADMDFVSPEPVIRALQERVAHGVFGYPNDMPELKEAIQARLERVYRWQVKTEEIVLIPGVVTGFNQVCQTFAGPGDGIFIQTPVYGPFLGASKNAGAIRQEMQLTRETDGSYSVDWDAFEEAITPETKVFLLCNPHNPVGRVFTHEELARMAEICLRHGVMVCSDDIHCDLVFSGHPHIPIATIDPEIAQQTITLMAPSKTFNLAGLNCSFAVIQNPELRKRFQQGRRGVVGGVNLLGLVAGNAAYREGQEWLDQLLAYLEGNRDFLYDYVKEHFPMFSMARPEGTYLAWLDCNHAGLDGSPQKFFLEQARVAFGDGQHFGKGGEGFIRINFGCPRAMLVEAMERVRGVLEKG